MCNDTSHVEEQELSRKFMCVLRESIVYSALGKCKETLSARVYCVMVWGVVTDMTKENESCLVKYYSLLSMYFVLFFLSLYIKISS